jgi:hypothetical protein
MYTLLLLVVLLFLVATTSFLDIMKALLLFALGFYLGKHWLELDLKSLEKAKATIVKAEANPV